ncbi:MAG: hypothetical protein [Microvirus sp.]|nr:MAG: hypothetical protein [Microvirus sp.]
MNAKQLSDEERERRRLYDAAFKKHAQKHGLYGEKKRRR